MILDCVQYALREDCCVGVAKTSNYPHLLVSGDSDSVIRAHAQSAGWIMAPKDVHVPLAWNLWVCYPTWQREVDDSRLPRWAWCNYKGPCKRGPGGFKPIIRYVRTEARGCCGVWKGQGMQVASRSWKRQKNRFSSQSLQKQPTLPASTLIFVQ